MALDDSESEEEEEGEEELEEEGTDMESDLEAKNSEGWKVFFFFKACFTVEFTCLNVFFSLCHPQIFLMKWRGAPRRSISMIQITWLSVSIFYLQLCH